MSGLLCCWPKPREGLTDPFNVHFQWSRLLDATPSTPPIILQEMILPRHERCYLTWQEPNCLPHRVSTSFWCDCISWWSDSSCLRTWEIEKSRKCRIQWQMHTVSIVLPAITLLTLPLCMLWNSLVCDDLSKAEILFSFLIFPYFCAAQSLYLQLLTLQKNSDSLFQCPVKQALKRASRYHGEGVQWQPEKKCHHLCVNISYVGGQVYWHLDDHPGPLSLAPIDCNSTYISQRQGQAHV